MTTPPLPTRPPCFPGGTDWLDGKWELDEGLPKSLTARWDADILDLDDRNKHDTIIEQDDNFLARFRVELKGRLWQAIVGTWCFDIGFTVIGKPVSRGNFNLSELIPTPADLCVPDWTGCKTQCILVEVPVPAKLIPANTPSTTYEVAASFTLMSCDRLMLAGGESLEEFLFTRI